MSDIEFDISAAFIAIRPFQAVCTVVCADGRRSKRPRTQKISTRTDVWQKVESSSAEGWYHANLRVSRETLDKTINMLQHHATENGFDMPKSNSYIDFRMEVAITLRYLSQE